MKRRLTAFIMVFLLVCAVAVVPASADSGPRQHATFKLEGLTEPCYLMLLSKERDWVPLFSGDETKEERRAAFDNALELSYHTAKGAEEDRAFEALDAYRDTDDYYFFGYAGYFAQEGSYDLYQPPVDVKVLLYFPQSDTLTVSEPVHLGNLENTVHVRVQGDKITSVSFQAFSLGSDPLSGFIWFNSLLVTLIVELLIALCFRFYRKKQIRTILLTNLLSQPLMTVLVLMINPPVYGSLFSFPYALFEIAVTVAEAAVYLRFLPKYEEKRTIRKWEIILYAVIANLATYAIAAFLPQYYLLAPLMLIF